MSDKLRGIIIICAVSAALAGAAAVLIIFKPVPRQAVFPAGSGNMRIQSPEFEQNGAIPAKFTCDGQDVSPRLDISGVPEAAASLVLVMDDPDAPMGDWVHWLVWNMPPRTTEIAEGAAPPGAVEGVTSFGKGGYGGPCPPSGRHRYFFKLYALDQTLALGPDAGAAQLEAAMNGHILDQAGLVGVYARAR